ncbi:MAG: hypothetical protein DI535_13720 [Citrobacter freundii]|nr:MAG: hypothetical protein DI535_13720 [Citrobacter freundii]
MEERGKGEIFAFFTVLSIKIVWLAGTITLYTIRIGNVIFVFTCDEDWLWLTVALTAHAYYNK